MPEQAKPGEKIFRGIPVSTGVCKGKILRLVQPEQRTLCAQTLTEEELPQQVQRLDQALVQIKDVPEETHRRLKARAALAGRSLSDYLRDQLEQIAKQPTLDEMLARLRSREPVTGEAAADALRAERAAR